MNARLTENDEGDIYISCEISGLPYTRTNEYGMFCNADPCTCEVNSMAGGPLMDAFLADLPPLDLERRDDQLDRDDRD